LRHNDPQILDQICSVLESSNDQTVKAQSLAELIRRSRGFRWVGIYDAAGDEIAAIAWTGADAPAVPRFPVSQGLCGAAVRSGTTIVVGDVTGDPRYLTTFGSTRSEIIVPILHPATWAILGLIDVESERVNAFTQDDRAFLEKCASSLSRLWD
jgi:L-methionine (R)-S-oxide reductase